MPIGRALLAAGQVASPRFGEAELTKLPVGVNLAGPLQGQPRLGRATLTSLATGDSKQWMAANGGDISI